MLTINCVRDATHQSAHNKDSDKGSGASGRRSQYARLVILLYLQSCIDHYNKSLFNNKQPGTLKTCRLNQQGNIEKVTASSSANFL